MKRDQRGTAGRDRSTRPSRIASATMSGFSPFHTSALDYMEAGFLPFPLPMGKKYPPPYGVPNDIAIDDKQVKEWLEGRYLVRDKRTRELVSKVDDRPKNIGMIVPDGIVVFDIDGEPGEECLRELEDQYGELPKTWMSFRGDPLRYHMWFATPPNISWPGKLGAGLDVIHRNYRYVVSPPSIHPSGNQYRWAYHAAIHSGGTAGYLPSPEEFAELPEEWLALANMDGYHRRDRAQIDAHLWLNECGKGKPCPELRRTLTRAQREIRKHADPGGLHDAMVNGVWSICAEIQNGHSGGKEILRALKDTFFAQREESGRRDSTVEVESEWSRACVGAIEKTAVEVRRAGDPCTVEEGERGKDPSRFFDPKHGVMSTVLLGAVQKTGRLEVGPGKLIYRHEKGLWAPDGESEIFRRTQRLLQDRYRPGHGALIKNMVEHRVPLITDDKQDTQYINTPNGLVHWETGELMPHNPNVISTVRIPIEWDEDAECPIINEWLSEVFPDDASELALEILGYMLYNDNPLHKAILLYGSGRNGKGTFIRLARMLVGHANISAVTPQALDSSQFSSAQLYGKLANLVGDVDPRIFKSTEQFKQLTGGDYMMAQHKHKDPFTFRCRALMIAAFNALPRTADTTEGFFSRWVVIPFTGFFPAGVADPSLIDRLTRQSELQGLLRAAVGGLQNVMRRGKFTIPRSVQEATDKFRIEADPIRGYAADRLEFMNSSNPVFTARTDIYADYVAWCVMNGYHQMAAGRFYEQLLSSVDEPIKIVTRNGIRGYVGVRLQG